MFNRQRFTCITAFSGWVESLPEDKTFDYMNPEYCLFASWAKACGGEGVACGGDYLISKGESVKFHQVPWLAEVNDEIAGDVYVISKSTILSVLGNRSNT